MCVIGRNGTGKSTLLQIIGGEVIPDAGTVWRQPALRIARLEQDVPLSTDRPVREVVADGFNDLAHVDDWHVDISVDMVISIGWTFLPTRSCRRCRADGAAACCSRARSWRSPICCCSTSRRTISTSRR